jgi:hypothetical protein
MQRRTKRETARKVVYTDPLQNHRAMLRLVAGQGDVGRLARRRHPGGDVPSQADSGPVCSLREIHRRPVESLTI